jgi:hypothetical protein
MTGHATLPAANAALAARAAAIADEARGRRTGPMKRLRSRRRLISGRLRAPALRMKNTAWARRTVKRRRVFSRPRQPIIRHRRSKNRSLTAPCSINQKQRGLSPPSAGTHCRPRRLKKQPLTPKPRRRRRSTTHPGLNVRAGGGARVQRSLASRPTHAKTLLPRAGEEARTKA